MIGKELLELFPEEIKKNADPERIEILGKTTSIESFREQLILFARESNPVWIYGFPRTGSTWLCKKFFDAFSDSQFMEPFSLFQCNSVTYTPELMNKGSAFEQPWLEIQTTLGLNSLAIDRLLLGIHKQFVFKFLFDFSVIPQLLQVFPKSRFVWMTRDGRDSVDSFANPDLDHWPYADFQYLGDDNKERFKGALERWVNFSKNQFRMYDKYQEQIYVLRYEDFVIDFNVVSKNLLDFSGLPLDERKLQELETGFKSRHGMWKNWENWQKEMFVKSSAEELNQTLHYGVAKENREFVWEETTL